MGSMLAAGFYHLLEGLSWKTANPGQDYDDLEAQAMDPSKKTLRPNVFVSEKAKIPTAGSLEGSPQSPQTWV